MDGLIRERVRVQISTSNIKMRASLLIAFDDAASPRDEALASASNTRGIIDDRYDTITQETVSANKSTAPMQVDLGEDENLAQTLFTIAALTATALALGPALLFTLFTTSFFVRQGEDEDDHEWKRRGFSDKASFDECMMLVNAASSNERVLSGCNVQTQYNEFKALGFTDKDQCDECKALGFTDKDQYDEFKELGFADRDQYDEFKALLFSTKDQYDECKTLGFTTRDQYDQYKALRFTTRSQYDEFKELAFTTRDQYDEFKELGFASMDDYLASLQCLICEDSISNRDERIGCASGHNICLSCGVTMTNTAIGNQAAHVKPQGIRCVAHSDALGACPLFLSFGVFERLQTLTAKHFGPEDCLKAESLHQLERFIAEANVAAAHPPEGLIRCPNCEYQFPKEERPNGNPRSRCPYCNVFICRECHVLYHEGLTCERRQALAEENGMTARYIAATTKPCPSCGTRISHFHGHACHHISPSGGCLNCHTHFCYACGATKEENERERGSKERCLCESICWSLRCKRTDLEANIVQLPYPHDRRCGCPICPDCRPGRPCTNRDGDPICDGDCVVCTGEVPPGPVTLPCTSSSHSGESDAPQISPPQHAGPAEVTQDHPPPPQPQRRRRGLRRLLQSRRAG